MKINEGHYLELMDRLHVQNCMVETHLLNHPLTKKIKKVKKLLIKSSSLLSEAYQIVGAKDYEINQKNNAIEKVIFRRRKNPKN